MSNIEMAKEAFTGLLMDFEADAQAIDTLNGLS